LLRGLVLGLCLDLGLRERQIDQRSRQLWKIRPRALDPTHPNTPIALPKRFTHAETHPLSTHLPGREQKERSSKPGCPALAQGQE
jgi:predicted metalloprotease with PDZ domain